MNIYIGSRLAVAELQDQVRQLQAVVFGLAMAIAISLIALCLHVYMTSI